MEDVSVFEEESAEDGAGALVEVEVSPEDEAAASPEELEGATVDELEERESVL
ncbi:MAG: hypothetical protein ACP5PJ_08695 [Acidimicrobiales bacterium]